MSEEIDIISLSSELGELLKERNYMLATAESCTGGNISATITAVPGSSEYYKGSIIAYSNEVKMNLLQVKEQTLIKHGAVSEETVREMVKGAMKSLNTDCAVATSGIAGPSGGTPDKPVGTVWIAAGSRKKIITLKQEKDEGREQNILHATYNALFLLRELLLDE
ncbi:MULTISPECIES: CinA family protein [unclassified Bacteroides]|jgi:nicotinamide-nucleotide amidase|uniref:CinA family protein n=1 Tax=unclassified Bacteroides TaxID=2646097 RepID=UPI000E831A6E|nr:MULTISPECIES: CinA family protein [unclassified Bacteroides]RGN45011.1 CinA family protein [Bacteroides sp. OM05-12]RHR72816.1 CinA family protein [Bacteroides sp. AF16-49]